MSSESAESVSKRKFSDRRLTGTYHAIARPATTTVENHGVRNRGCTAANARGSALCRAIENEVRDDGMMVGCVEAIADVTIARITSLSHGDPSTSPPSVAKIASSSSYSESVSSPANASTAVETPTYVTRRITVESTAASPGADAESRVSSVRFTALSQPQ